MRTVGECCTPDDSPGTGYWGRNEENRLLDTGVDVKKGHRSGVGDGCDGKQKMQEQSHPVDQLRIGGRKANS